MIKSVTLFALLMIILTPKAFSQPGFSGDALAGGAVGERIAGEAMAWERCTGVVRTHIRSHFDQMLAAKPKINLDSVDVLNVREIVLISTAPYTFRSTTMIRANYKTESGDAGSLNTHFEVQSKIGSEDQTCEIVK